MILLQSEELINHLGSIIHRDTQQHPNHFDLTVTEIHELTEAGSLDFGGSEFQPAHKRPVETQKKNPEDDYGWWHLSKGMYQATMNEQIKEFKDTIAFIAPHSHTQQAGIIANTIILSSEEEGNSITMNFRVPEAGCNIKENARFAVLYLLAS
jgi:deoxycytidine triphosphate deaminase